MANSQNLTSSALIVGVTGMAGLSIAEALKRPTAPRGPWVVYGAARRSQPTWFPSSVVDHYMNFDATNFEDTVTTLSPIASKITHLFWVAIQVRLNEEDNASVNSIMLSNVLKALTINSKSINLRHVTLQTGTKHYICPIFSMGKVQLHAHERPFCEKMDRLPYPNFYYALEDVVKSYNSHFTYSIHRPSIIIGASCRSVYNVLLTLAVYAEICKYLNMPCRFPGTMYAWEYFSEMTDAHVLATQHVWAATNEKAHNEAFNCTNGDVFTWKRMSQVLCDVFGVEFVPLEDANGEFDMVKEMNDKGPIWDKIVEEKGLVKTKMEEITSFFALQAIMRFNFQFISSMNKSREFGFMECVDSLKSVRFWVGKLREMNIIP